MSRLATTFAALLLATAGAVGPAAAADAHSSTTSVASTAVVPIAPGAFHEIRNSTVNRTRPVCIEPLTPAVDGQLLIQAICDGSSIQGWAVLNDGNNHYRFVNNGNGLCIVLGDNPNSSDEVKLGKCEVAATGLPLSNAQWTSSASLPNQAVTLRTHVGATDHNLCLGEDRSEAHPVGAVMLGQSCDGSLRQVWSVGFN